MAETVLSSPVIARLRDLVSQRAGARLLPTALDGPALALAAGLGLPVFLYGHGSGEAGSDAVRVTAVCNTKAGFRKVAEGLGMCLPDGRICRGPDLPGTARSLLNIYESVVVKPDRSAGGHGLRFVSTAQLPLEPGPEESVWVVEEYVDHARSISAQFLATVSGSHVLFNGEMHTRDGSFTGYRSPLHDIADSTVKELERWGLDLGDHLSVHGYRGTYDIEVTDSPRKRACCDHNRTATGVSSGGSTSPSRCPGRQSEACTAARRATDSDSGREGRLLEEADIATAESEVPQHPVEKKRVPLWLSVPAGRRQGRRSTASFRSIIITMCYHLNGGAD